MQFPWFYLSKYLSITISISVFLSHKDQDQGGQTGKYGSQGDPAEKEKTRKAGHFEEERPEEAHSVPEERSRLPLRAARKSRKHIPHHGTQGGQTIPSHRHSQVGQIQQRVQKDHEKTQKPQVPCL